MGAPREACGVSWSSLVSGPHPSLGLHGLAGAVLFPGPMVLGVTLILLGLLFFGVAGTLVLGGVWLLTGAAIAVLVIVLGFRAQRFA